MGILHIVLREQSERVWDTEAGGMRDGWQCTGMGLRQ